MRLGRLPAKHDTRTLRLARYISIPVAPGDCDWTKPVEDWQMFANDTVGDCTCATAGHMVQSWTANATQKAPVSAADVLAMYSAITGYDPADPDSDQGAYCLDVLKYWRSVGLAGHRIGAFVAVDPDKRHEVRAGLWLFGGLYLGLDLPVSAQDQDVWDVVSLTGDGAPGSWGGHAVPVLAYAADDAGLTIITWGGEKRITWAFLEAYCSEAYAILSQDFLSKGVAPNGFDLAALQADLAALSGMPAPSAPTYKAVQARFPALGVDTVAKIDASHAAALYGAGMRFAMRYLGSITAQEIAGLTGAGLMVSFICYPPQHSGWAPTASDGLARGKAAVVQAKALALPAGVTIWIDLEGCRGPASATTAWCEAFAAELVAAGYQAGLYVGAAPGGLNSAELYALKKVTRYWHSCSRSIPEPANRGYCLEQLYKPNQTIAGVVVDVNCVRHDFLGCLPTFLSA